MVDTPEISNTQLTAEALEKLNEKLFSDIVLTRNTEFMIEDLKEDLENGADINSRDKSGNSLLGWAMFRNDMKLFDFLLENGADPNGRDIKTHHLECAIKRVDEHPKEAVEMVNKLLERGANPNDTCVVTGLSVLEDTAFSMGWRSKDKETDGISEDKVKAHIDMMKNIIEHGGEKTDSFFSNLNRSLGEIYPDNAQKVEEIMNDFRTFGEKERQSPEAVQTQAPQANELNTNKGAEVNETEPKDEKGEFVSNPLYITREPQPEKEKETPEAEVKQEEENEGEENLAEAESEVKQKDGSLKSESRDEQTMSQGQNDTTGFISQDKSDEKRETQTTPQIDSTKPARSSLHMASDRQTTENINDVIAQNMDDINKPSNDEYGVTPLMCAVNKGNTDMVDALIANGADLNMANNVGETALMYAASKGDMELLGKLIENGANTEMKAGKGSVYEGKDFKDVLRINLEASGKSQDEINQTMAKVEEMIAGKPEQEQTGVLTLPNEKAAEKQLSEERDFHDKANWDRVGVRNNEGGIDEGYRFNLSGMSKEEMNEFVGNLQENGIKGDLRQATIDTDNVKEGDLSYRITDPESVKRLEGLVFGEKQQESAEKGIKNTDTQKIDVIKDGDKKTATEQKEGNTLSEKTLSSEEKEKLNTEFFLESAFGTKDQMVAAIEKGADINYSDNVGGATALLSVSGKVPNEEANKENNLKFNYLLEHGADVNKQNVHGNTPLMIATRDDDIEKVDALLEHKADPNLKEDLGYTALMIAASKNNGAIADKLLEHDADPNIQDDIGRTALMRAAKGNFSDIADKLLEHDADPNIQTKGGWRAILSAASNGNSEMVKGLIEHGAETEWDNPEVPGKKMGYQLYLKDALKKEGKTDEEIKKTIDDIEKTKADKEKRDKENTEQTKTSDGVAVGQERTGIEDKNSVTENEQIDEKKNAERQDFHDRANWDRVGVRNNEGGIDEGYRFNLSGMSKEEMNEFLGNLQENGIKGDLRVATEETDSVKVGDLSYRVTDPASVSRLEGAVFGEKQTEQGNDNDNRKTQPINREINSQNNATTEASAEKPRPITKKNLTANKMMNEYSFAKEIPTDLSITVNTNVGNIAKNSSR